MAPPAQALRGLRRAQSSGERRLDEGLHRKLTLIGGSSRAAFEEKIAVDTELAGLFEVISVEKPIADDTADLTRPVHTTLLGAGIPIAEHLTALARLPEEDFRFYAVPVKVRGMGTFPVRAVAVIDD